ncbi:MAG: kynureninase [Thermoanaerobaculia bacterium]|nr:kynureninase [Thermoanaerobaculia bacterium]
MIGDPQSLYQTPNALAAHYSRFRVDRRLLLTGHSHQAWPDRAESGHQRAWDDAAECVDEKWERAFERADRVRSGYARLLDADPDEICLGASTHDLVVKWLSALPLRERPRVVTTDAEFHSARRQLKRLEEEGLEVVQVVATPAHSVGERLAAVVDDRAAAVIVSSVFFDTAEIAGGLDLVATQCAKHGVALLVDTYHQLNVVPFSLVQAGLETAYFTGGGYKYCQLGEGNAYLRSPPDCTLRPVITGWFAEFDELADAHPDRVSYGPLSLRFAGATYDPTSNYRAAEVFDFFDDMCLTPELLREVSQHQISLLRDAVDDLDLPPHLLGRRDVPIDQLGGFLALQSPRATELQQELARRGVLTDSRRDTLRMGPAPYLSDSQLQRAVSTLGEVGRDLLAG